MNFSQPKRRRQMEPALPMINVVFLLLIFFLMSAQLTSPRPFDVTLPIAAQGRSERNDLSLHLSAEGKLALHDLRDIDVWNRLETHPTPAEIAVFIRADARLPAAELATVLTRLSALGFGHVSLAATPQ